MTDVTSFLSGHKPRVDTVVLCPDAGLLAEIVELREQARTIAGSDDGTLADSDLDDVNARLEQLRQRAEQSQYRLHVRSVGRSVWSALSDLHQPDADTVETWRRYGARIDWDPDTFPPAAIAACLTRAEAPDGTVLEFAPARRTGDGVDVDPAAAELAQAVWDDFEFGETTRLWTAVNSLNTGVTSVPKSVTVSGRTRTSPVRSGQPESMASPDLSSSDDGSLAG